MYIFECNHCKGCDYNRPFIGHGVKQVNACHFLLDTGKMRGCEVENCKKWKPAQPRPTVNYSFNR